MTPARRARITIVTAGHLSTSPRMLKSADALSAAGYDVRVVATRHEPWAVAADRDVAARRSWTAAAIDYRRGDSGATYWWSGARHRGARAVAAALGPRRAPLAVVSRAFGRVHSELVRAIAADPGDLIYGGTTGALAAVAEAGRRCGTPYAVDFEDFHAGETGGADATMVDALAARVERAVIPGAAFVTTSSEAIAAAYRERDGVEMAVIHNTFPLPAQAPDASRVDPARLRVYWFSQTIGPGRGLEDAILALGRAGVAALLALRGRPRPGYLDSLRSLAAARAPRLELVHLEPAPPDAMIDLARGFDVGLALEQSDVRNHQLALSNKALTYVLAGVAVIFTDTPGQHALGIDLGRAAALVPVGDVDALAAAFARWAHDPAELECAKRTAWHAAARRWHWEHALERGRLCGLVREALS
jgi:glycosyltransferase involved in cell wall biosynthesis